MRNKRPLIFLNACESGITNVRVSQSVGWAEAFIYSGASIFIGTAWKVRSAVATRFAQTFYRSVFQGMTLMEATEKAREASRSFKSTNGKSVMDATGLAYRFFGHPLARRNTSVSYTHLTLPTICSV